MKIMSQDLQELLSATKNLPLMQESVSSPQMEEEGSIASSSYFREVRSASEALVTVQELNSTF